MAFLNIRSFGKYLLKTYYYLPNSFYVLLTDTSMSKRDRYVSIRIDKPFQSLSGFYQKVPL